MKKLVTMTMMLVVAVLATGAQGALTYTTNLAVWVDAEHVVLDGSGNVTSWVDQATGAIGNGTSENASLVVGAPTVAASSINGHDAVQYGGGAGHSFIGALGVTGSNVTVFLVAKATTSAAQGPAFSVGDVSGAGADKILGGDIGTSTSAIFRYNAGFTEFNRMYDASFFGITVWEIETGDTHNTADYWGNGNSGIFFQAINGDNSINLEDNGYTVGAILDSSGNISSGVTGYVAEVLIYTGTLTAAEQNSVGYYLEDKYGLDTEYTPEPATMGLLGVGGLLALVRRRQR